jgi:hypothetical protein
MGWVDIRFFAWLWSGRSPEPSPIQHIAVRSFGKRIIKPIACFLGPVSLFGFCHRRNVEVYYQETELNRQAFGKMPSGILEPQTLHYPT